MEEENVRVNVTVKGVIELPQLDVTKYIGNRVKIESAEVFKGNYGYYLKVSTEVVDSAPVDKAGKAILDKEGKPLVLRASRIFGLQVDENANVGWGADTKTGQFMAKNGISQPDELIGKVVAVQTVTNKADGKDYLSFN